MVCWTTSAPARAGRRRAAAGAIAVAVVAALAVPIGTAWAGTGPGGGTGPDAPSGTGPTVFQVGDLEFALFGCRDSGNQPLHAYRPYTVPAGAHSVYVEAVGGEGETPNPDQTGWGGLGAQVTGSLTVKPGDQLSVAAGCAGSSEGGASVYAPGGARGVGHDRQSFPISSYGISGGGGGGASAVLTGGSPLVVSGGGGGAAGSATGCFEIAFNNPGTDNPYVCGPGPGGPPAGPKGGNGGAGGHPAGDGGVGQRNPFPAAPGGGDCPVWTQAAGQAGEAFDNVGAGGAGGGGGGGYVGGCGGTAAPDMPVPDPPPDVLEGIAGNGGAGGLAYADPTLVGSPRFATSDNAGDGYVLFVSGAEALRTFDYGPTGSVASRCVPSGTDRIFVDAVGGAGGGGGEGFGGVGTGGGGGHVLAVVPATAGTQLGISVGKFGGGGGGWGDGHGGDQGSGEDDLVTDGGGGGGSSAVRATPVACDAPPLTNAQYAAGEHLVVAGGGGGGGGDGSFGAGTYPGGDGGSGGATAGAGEHGGGPAAGADGGCGGRVLGSGDPDDPCIDSLDGGDGTDNTTGGGGGGGGGGYFGGGKGHAASDGEDGGGGGGGAGGSFARAVDPTQVDYGTGPDGGHSADGKVTLIVPFPAARDEVRILGGSRQSAYPGQAYGAPLEVQALDDNGFPMAQTPITFTAPPGRVVFPGGSATSLATTTDQDGKASVAVVAQNPPWVPGPFPVTASVTSADVKPASFPLYNRSFPTAVTLTSSTPGNEGNPDQPVRFTATVALATSAPTPAPGTAGFGIPTGGVVFSADGTVLDTVPLDASGQATSPAVTLPKGVHQITAAYQGDAGMTFAPSRVSVAQIQDLAAVSASLAAAQSTIDYGNPLQLTMAISGPPNVPVAPSGTVSFSVNGVDQGTVPLGPDGAAVAPAVNGLGAGLHTASALYSGDAGFVGALRTASVYVKAASAVSAGHTYTSGQGWTFTATVTSATPGVTAIPQGIVTFTNTGNGQQLAQVALDAAGVAATPPIASLCCYINTIRADYSGEDRFHPSSATTTAYDIGGVRRPPGTPPTPPDVLERVRTRLAQIAPRLAAILGSLPTADLRVARS